MEIGQSPISNLHLFLPKTDYLRQQAVNTGDELLVVVGKGETGGLAIIEPGALPAAGGLHNLAGKWLAVFPQAAG